MAAFGIHVTLIEPGGFATDWAGPSAHHSEPLAAYADYREEVQKQRASRNSTPGDPAASGQAVLKVVDADAPPLRVFFGDGPLAIATQDYESRLATWREWEPVSIAAGGEGDD